MENMALCHILKSKSVGMTYGVIVEAVNHPTLHHTSIIHAYEVFDHLHMLWNGIWVHPYTVMMVQGGGKFWKIGVWRSKNNVVVSLLRL